ncbi:trans-resveratrol di-O-methyltransferase [Ziziphus jujuba]|uniref:Trans-resveratrol di-O-methyltransferase n=1 Tax=Ziziphus jujuba TaxID=326968 RepID=A0A6P3Z8H1_ZIZJJ|nr:trans-resveratrol di-O-methyltransferase [Ziziphus jujuba]
MDLVEGSELFQAQSHLYKYMSSCTISMCLKCAVELGIPDIIHNHGRPIALPDLVTALEIHPSKTRFVYRLMSLLVHSGFFAATLPLDTNQEQGDHQKEEEAAYDLTPSSRLLLKDKLPCLSPFVLALLDPCLITPCLFMGKWFKGDRGTTPFESAHGMQFWEYADHNPAYNSLFNEAMACDSEMLNLVIKDCKPVFQGLGSLVDVGGGTGKFARIITETFPQLKCTVLDRPHVVANLPDTQNLKFIAGDMFQSIPSADALLLKLTLHSYSDEECLKILKKCREAIPSDGGKVIVIDIVINKNEDEHEVTETKLLIDVMRMSVATGRERSQRDWEKLFLGSGFSRYNIAPIFGLKSLIEVFP